MSTPVELEIRALLNKHQYPDLAADELIKKWEKQPLSKSEMESICAFLITNEFYPTLVTFVLKNIEKPEIVPWPLLAESIGKIKSSLDPKIIEALKMGAEKQGEMTSLSRSRSIDRFMLYLEEYRAQEQNKIAEKLEQEKSRQIQELSILRNQLLFDREKRLIDKLLRQFPGDKDILQELDYYKERKALDTLERRNSRKNRKFSFNLKSPLAESDKSAAQNILVACQDILETYPELRSDFAIMLFQMEAYGEALSLLQSINLDLSEKWLKVELLIHVRRFLEALELLRDLELETATDPDTPLAVAYLRAQAFHGLGQRQLAIEVLQSIVENKPQYRFAQSLLDIWADAEKGL